MRHSNRRGHSANNPYQQNPQPSRVRQIRENRNSFMNDSDDYYGRYNRHEQNIDDEEDFQPGQREHANEERSNQSNYYDQGQRFNRGNDYDSIHDPFERDQRFQPQRGYGNEQEFDRYRSSYDSNSGYESAWQQQGRAMGNNSNAAINHRGKGPKGYARSTERIKEDVYDRLSDDYQLDASNIEVEIKDNEVILKGTVTDRNSKRRAEDVVESVSGITHVENRIRVNRDWQNPLQEKQASGSKSKAENSRKEK